MLNKKNIFRLIFQFFNILFFSFFIFSNSFAQVIISEAFPNTVDDKNLEYIKLKNLGNDTIFLNNWYLEDKSGKKYFFDSQEKLEKLQEKKFFRTETKIILNNTKEEIFLYNNFGELENSFSYKTSKKGEKIINTPLLILPSNQGGEGEKIDENFLEKIGNIFNDNDIVYKNLEKIDCEKFLENEKFEEILLEINNGNLGILEKKYLEECGKSLSPESSLPNVEKETTKKLELPEIILEFQRPSYILDLDKLEDKRFFKFEITPPSIPPLEEREVVEEKEEKIKEFFCDNKKEECKINFNLEKSFTGSFLEKNYLCEIKIGDEIIKKCNPNTIIFKEGETKVVFKILQKNNEDNFVEKSIKIINKKESLSPESSLPVGEKGAAKEEEKNDEKIEKINILEPKIIVQSGLDENNFCKSNPCSINLLYEAKNKREKCIWDFGEGISKSLENNKKCNPSYVKFEKTGKFFIKLKVYDELDEKNFKEKILYFENKEKKKKKSLTSSLIKGGKKEEKTSPQPSPEGEGVIPEKKEVIENEEFYIFLQGKKKKNIEFVGKKIICYTYKNSCKLNFGLNFKNKKHLRKIKYYWNFGNYKFYYKKNPKTIEFNTGKYFVRVRARHKGKIIGYDFRYVEVIKIKKLKLETLKLKKKKFKKIKIKQKKYKKIKIKKQKIYKPRVKIAKKKKIKISKKQEKITTKKRNKKKKKNSPLTPLLNNRGEYKKLEKIKDIDLKIILQGKKSSKKIFKNNKIICYTKKNKTCKINLGFEKFDSVRGLKYVWKFSDGRIIKKKNPKSLDFKVGNYNVVLEVFYKNKIIKTKKISIFVYEEKRNLLSKKGLVSKKGKKNKQKKKNFFITSVGAYNVEDKIFEENSFFDQFLYLIISIITLFLVYVILRNKGFLEE